MLIRIIMMSMFILLCYGCSFIFPVYIVNESPHDVELIVTLKTSSDTTELVLDWDNSTDRGEAYKSKKSRINYELLDGQRIKIIIPKRSTINLCYAFNKKPDYFSRFVFCVEKKKLVLAEDQFFKKMVRENFYKIFQQRNFFILKEDMLQ